VRFLADMNISPRTVRILTDAGYDVVRVGDVMSPSASDAAVLAYARRSARVVITQDMDFSALLALSGHASPSVISLRLSSADPAGVAARLVSVMSRYETELTQGCAISVGDDVSRLRRLPVRY